MGVTGGEQSPSADAYCTTLATEPKTRAVMSSGLGKYAFGFADFGQIVRFEWGSNQYIQFRTRDNRNPFVDRRESGSCDSAGSCNQLFELEDFSTSDTKLAGWVRDGGGATFCVSNSESHDSEWAVVPKNNEHWSLKTGCNGGGWAGKGAYYGQGWVGVRDDGPCRRCVVRLPPSPSLALPRLVWTCQCKIARIKLQARQRNGLRTSASP